MTDVSMPLVYTPVAAKPLAADELFATYGADGNFDDARGDS